MRKRKPRLGSGHSSLTIVRKYHPEVEVVEDATESVQIEVLPEDCRKGRRMMPAACVMAKAAAREGGYDGVIVSATRAYLVKGKIATRYDLPMSVQKEIVSYDRSERFEPGSYQLSRIAQSDRFESQRERSAANRIARKKNGKNKGNQHHTTGIRSV